MNPDQDPRTPEWAERFATKIAEASDTDRTRARVTYAMAALRGDDLRALAAYAEHLYADAKARGEACS